MERRILIIGGSDLALLDLQEHFPGDVLLIERALAPKPVDYCQKALEHLAEEAQVFEDAREKAKLPVCLQTRGPQNTAPFYRGLRKYRKHGD
jgi:hypothetical protein